VCTACLTHLILLDLIILTNIYRSSNYGAPHYALFPASCHSCHTFHNMLIFYNGEFLASCSTPQAGCSQLVIQYSCRCLSYLEAISVCNLKMCHVMVTKDPLNMADVTNNIYKKLISCKQNLIYGCN
jgi:hypothetical protein